MALAHALIRARVDRSIMSAVLMAELIICFAVAI